MRCYDAAMTKDEIMNLGSLARITLTPDEVTHFNTEIESILEYVSTIKALAGESEDGTELPAVRNVLRPDEVTHTPGEYTERLLAAAPHTEGAFVAVKKILNQTD